MMQKCFLFHMFLHELWLGVMCVMCVSWEAFPRKHSGVAVLLFAEGDYQLSFMDPTAFSELPAVATGDDDNGKQKPAPHRSQLALLLDRLRGNEARLSHAFPWSEPHSFRDDGADRYMSHENLVVTVQLERSIFSLLPLIWRRDLDLSRSALTVVGILLQTATGVMLFALLTRSYRHISPSWEILLARIIMWFVVGLKLQCDFRNGAAMLQCCLNGDLLVTIVYPGIAALLLTVGVDKARRLGFCEAIADVMNSSWACCCRQHLCWNICIWKCLSYVPKKAVGLLWATFLALLTLLGFYTQIIPVLFTFAASWLALAQSEHPGDVLTNGLCAVFICEIDNWMYEFLVTFHENQPLKAGGANLLPSPTVPVSSSATTGLSTSRPPSPVIRPKPVARHNVSGDGTSDARVEWKLTTAEVEICLHCTWAYVSVVVIAGVLLAVLPWF